MKSCGSYSAMILIQLAYGGSNILIKIALDKGLNQLVFVVYRHLIAWILLGPFAYVLERKQRPTLWLPIITKIFVLASLGTTVHLNVYYAGLAYTSATVASAMSNVIPSLTFLMAALLRMEKVKIRSARGWAKVLGTTICIGGSLIFTFWKGGFLYKNHVIVMESWIKGSALILTSNIAWSGWLILRKEGPVFAAMFSPLLLIIVGIFSAIAFAERLLLGSLIGAIFIILGVYCVLWGKLEDDTTTSKAEEGKAIVDDGKPVEININGCPSANPEK
ncbi:hypothetical protein P3X46_016920 [Hevea brasiliensis]|uniref:WAT1-related protein n=1 Tax=Hevea brasiliensis TaxID=3981 RepID=A0ABQ9M0M4_HEVBR|nr:hypothetical protein P3X46_016920 [Hevea brasiliensis]